MTQRLQITNCKTSRIGEIVVMKEITDINTINSPPTNQVNRLSKTQAPASCGPTPLVKSKSDPETSPVTPGRGPRAEVPIAMLERLGS